MNEQTYFAANRDLWNSRVSDHLTSGFYSVGDFRNGKNPLMRVELEQLGDVSGKSLLHLQCHFGMDTLAWARLGATVTGMDISDEAIRAAEKLRDETGLDGEFVCCNLYDLPDHLEGQFDIVFTSYGTIGWLPDLDRWAKVVAHFLKPGGTFFIADFHPVVWMLDEELKNIRYSYFNREVIATEASGSYAAKNGKPAQAEYGWNHSFGEIFSALLNHGLKISHFEEYPFTPYNCFANLEQRSDGMWISKDHGEKLPMMYSLKAVK
jgi:2-polyprenyl-3-methyl-5-hydroxy-6-metoxy-1,4-benzoquinol methylase